MTLTPPTSEQKDYWPFDSTQLRNNVLWEFDFTHLKNKMSNGNFTQPNLNQTLNDNFDLSKFKKECSSDIDLANGHLTPPKLKTQNVYW